MKSFKFLNTVFNESGINLGEIAFEPKESIFLKIKMDNRCLVGKLDCITFKLDDRYRTRFILKYSNLLFNRPSNSGLLSFRDGKDLSISKISEKDYKKIACIT